MEYVADRLTPRRMMDAILIDDDTMYEQESDLGVVDGGCRRARDKRCFREMGEIGMQHGGPIVPNFGLSINDGCGPCITSC